MESLGYEATPKDILELVVMFDEDNSGAIDFLEFIELLQRVPRVSQYSSGFKHLALSSPSVSS